MRSGWPARRKRRWQHTASWSGSGPGPAHPRCRAGRRNAPGPPGGPAGVTALLPVIYSGVQRPRCGQTGCRCAPPGQAASPARDRALPSRRRNIRSQPRNSKRHSSGRERKAPVTPAAQRQPPPERGQPPSLPPSLPPLALAHADHKFRLNSAARVVVHIGTSTPRRCIARAGDAVTDKRAARKVQGACGHEDSDWQA